jgi:hypothetical protein
LHLKYHTEGAKSIREEYFYARRQSKLRAAILIRDFTAVICQHNSKIAVCDDFKRAMGQVKGPALVFRPALERIQAQARIPILLPSKLPVS